MANEIKIKRYVGGSWTQQYPEVRHTDIVTSGTPSATTFLNGDGAWATPAGTTFNGGTITNNLSIENAGPNLTLKDTTDSDDISLLFKNTSNSTVGQFTTTGNRLNIITNFSNGLSIDASKVGIGTTSPAEKLHIDGGSIYVVDNGGNPRVVLGDNLSSGGYGQIQWNSSTDVLQLGSSLDTDSLAIAENGNVGIGTTLPSDKLEVVGNVRANRFTDRTNTSYYVDPASTSVLYNIDIQNDATFRQDVTIQGDLTINGSYTQIDTNTSTTEQWSVENDGTGPAVIINQVGAQPIMRLQDDGVTKVEFGDNGDIELSSADLTLGSGSYQHLARSSYITFYGDNSPNHSIASRNSTYGADDDIRINTYGSLFINLDSNNNNTSAASFEIGRHGGTGTISDWLLKVDGETGNLGLGTRSPSQKLDVNGNAIISGDNRYFTMGTPGAGTTTGARFFSIEGNTDTSGEGSGRIFFTEHNSSTAAMDNYGMSLGYRGGASSIEGASGNTWTGLSQISNGQWGMWGHNNSAAGALIMSGDRAATFIDFHGNELRDPGDITIGANTIDFNANSGNSTTAQLKGDRSTTDLDTRNFTTEGGFSYTTFDGSTSNKPSGSYNNANGVITMNTHSGAYNWQLAFTNNQGKMFARYRNGGSYSSWNEILTSATSVNADTLDNVNSTSFLRSDTADTALGDITFSGNIVADLRIKSNSPDNNIAPINIKSDAEAQAIHIEEPGAGNSESWQIGVNGDGDLNFYNSGASTPTIQFYDSNSVFFPENVTMKNLQMTSVQNRTKIRVWSGSTYGMGMHSGFTYGGLGASGGEYAMTFQMNDDLDRGFWWGHSVHTTAQGAMALTTDGELTVANAIRVGYGETDTTTPADNVFDINGNVTIAKTTTGGQNQIKFQEAGTTKTQLTSNYGDNKFYLYHEGDNVMTIDSSSKTSFNGEVDITGTTTIDNVLILERAETSYGAGIRFSEAGVKNWEFKQDGDGGNNDSLILSNASGTSIIAYEQNGNVSFNSGKIQLNANGNLVADGDLYLNNDAGASDAVIYFGDDDSTTAHRLYFDDSAQQFTFTNRVTASAGRLGAIESNGSDVDKVNFQLSGTTLTITTS